MKKYKFLFLLTFGVILLFPMFSLMNNSFIENLNSSFKHDNNNLNEEIKSSSYWSLGRISIDGTATGVDAHNWSWAASQPWCTGSGGLSDPYVIRNITIDAGDNGDCLSIKNSDVYFIIKNSTFYNADGSGIKLENVENGKFSNNTIRDNGNFGIWLINSMYCEIVNNSIFNNGYDPWTTFPESFALGGGIALWSSHNNTIKDNFIESNRGFGVALGHTIIYLGSGLNWDPCYHNIVSSNFLNNTGNAIWALPQSQYNNISDNSIFGSRIFLEGSLNTKLVRNNLTYSFIELGGPIEAEASYYIDTTNTINGKSIYYYANEKNINKDNVSGAGQIILVNCRDSLVENIDLSACFDIVLDYCSNITLKKNNLSSFIDLFHTDNSIIIENRGELSFGISYSHNNSFLNNFFNKTYNSIWIGHSNHTIISENYFHGDYIKIWVYYSYYNQLSKNVILSKNQSSYSDRISLQLRESYHNTIIENEILYAEIGLQLIYSDYNTISNNLINQTDIGIYLGGCDSNTISNNLINQADIGIYLGHSNYNTVKNNVLVCNNACFYIDTYSTGNVIENNWCNGVLSGQEISGYFPTLVIFWIFVVSIIIYVYNERIRKEGKNS